MKKTHLTFGKHKGSSLEAITFNNPEYIIWLHGQSLRDTKLQREVARFYPVAKLRKKEITNTIRGLFKKVERAKGWS